MIVSAHVVECSSQVLTNLTVADDPEHAPPSPLIGGL
jgi:hypothetical protein